MSDNDNFFGSEFLNFAQGTALLFPFSSSVLNMYNDTNETTIVFPEGIIPEEMQKTLSGIGWTSYEGSHYVEAEDDDISALIVYFSMQGEV